MTGYLRTDITVRDLRRSLAFYRDGLGLAVIDERSGSGRSTVTLAMPGTSATWLLEEHHGVERHDASARPCDPGFAHVCLYTGDAHGLFDRLHGLGFASRAPVATLAAGPHKGASAVYVLDPDGFAVELYQRAGESGPPTVSGFFHHGLTVRDMDETMSFWLQDISASLTTRGTRPGEVVAPIVGLRPDTMEAAFVGLRDDAQIELFEYRGIERHPATARQQDPAASRLVLLVDNAEATRARLGGDHDAHGRPRIFTPDGYPVVLAEE